MTRSGSSTVVDQWAGRLVGGRWRIVSLLGDSGGMVSVYLAEDARLPRKAVVKIPKAAHHHAEFADRVALEASWQARVPALPDLNLVRILDLGEDAGIPFQVLQYLSGGNLKAWCEQNPSFLAEPRLHHESWLLPLAKALDALADRGLLHRNVKPSNVLFDCDGRAFLADCGVDIAVITKAPHGMSRGIGSLEFLSPELCQSERVVLDGRSDQYGLAMTVYQVLTGWKFPVSDAEVVQLIAVKLGFAPLTEPREHELRIPRAANAAVVRALAPDRKRRFATNVEFADAVVAGFAAVGRPAVGGVPPVMPFQRWMPILLFGSAGLLATAIAGVTLCRVDGRPQLRADQAGRIAKAPEPSPSFLAATTREESPRFAGQEQIDFTIFDETRTWVSAQGKTAAVERNAVSLLDPRADTDWLASAGLTDRFAGAHGLFPEGFPMCVAAFPASFGLADRLDVIAASRLTARTLRLGTCSEVAALGYEARRRAASRSMPENVVVLVVSAHAVGGTRAELDDGLVCVAASSGIDRRTIATDQLAHDLAHVADMLMGGDGEPAIGKVVVTCPQPLEQMAAEAVAAAALPVRASVVPDLVADGLAALGAVLTGTRDDLLLLMRSPATHLGVLVAGTGNDEFITAVAPGTPIPTDRKIVVRMPDTADHIVIAEKSGDLVRLLHTLQLGACDRRDQGRVLEVLFDIDANMGLRVEAAELGVAAATWSAPNR